MRSGARDHDRHRRGGGVVPSGVRARGQRRGSCNSASGKRTTYPLDVEDGYLAEWRALADVLNGRSVVEYDELLEDARYALAPADAASELIAGAR